MSSMEAGRKRNFETAMRGCINQEKVLTDNYLPRKCDYTDRIITPRDTKSVQLAICEIKKDGTIDLAARTFVSLCGYVRATGYSDQALDKVMQEKQIAH